MMSYRYLARLRTASVRDSVGAAKAATKKSLSFSTSSNVGSAFGPKNAVLLFGAFTASCVAVVAIHEQVSSRTSTSCDSKPPKGGLLFGQLTKEPSTGIMFPQLCNAMTFVGCGCRVKWGLIKVYAVGTYVDPTAMAAVKTQGADAIGKALLDPNYPRTIRIVMNRGLSIDKYTGAIVEALTPRMKGEDLDKLEEFKKLNPQVDLIEGAEMEMTIRGDTMLYKNSAGGVGSIHSVVFCRAMCDVYYGTDAVSPGHKEDVIRGIQKL